MPLTPRRRGMRLALGVASAALAGLLASCTTTSTAPRAAATGSLATDEGPIDYTRGAAWLCRPGRQDACAQPLSLTTVAADGRRSVGPTLTADATAPIDCFYVYPTVSNDATPNSDMTAGPEEQAVAFVQLSPFRTQCRLFAPLYRQVTLTALRSLYTARPMVGDRALAYGDVRAAWRHYLAHDNHGRGVVLIGHSQGSGVLMQLVAQEIEGQPAQHQIVSVIIPGANLLVPPGRDVGGSFKSTPLCRAATQTGCAIAYVSFRASAPPPARSLFGHAPGGSVVACTNPAALAGGEARPRAWFTHRAGGSGGSGSTRWQALAHSIETPFFALPGLLSTRCVTDEHGAYLAVQVHGDARTDDIGGDVEVAGVALRAWGLHLIDVNLGLGDLIDVVHRQAQAYLAATK